MKTLKISIVVLASITFIFTSCKKENLENEIVRQTSTTTNLNSGIQMRYSRSGVVTILNNTGIGFACPRYDTVSSTWSTNYGLALGDSIVYDPIMGAIYHQNPISNDVVSLGWGSNSSVAAIGTYTGDFFAGEVNGSYINADASGLTVNVSYLTIDSIGGTFSGTVEEYNFVYDSVTNNITPVLSGNIDSLTGSFLVSRAGC